MFQGDSLSLSYEQLRSVMVEMLRSGGCNEIGQLKAAIPPVAIRMGLMTDPAGPQIDEGGRQIIQHGRVSQLSLSHHDYGRARNIFWDLVIEGILRPGLADGVNNDLPWFHITEWGKAALERGPQTPYDPDGYLKGVQAEIPTIDPIIITYLNESLRTFRIGCLLSSTIALGCAAEKALLLLIEAYGDSLPAKMKAKFKANTDGRMIKRQFDEFRKMLDSELRARLPSDLDEGLDIELSAIFDFIRNQRNDAGHPTGRMVDREVAYANLIVLRPHLRKAYALKDWVMSNPKP